MTKRESFKLDSDLLDKVKELKQQDNRTIVWHIERAIQNYLKAKKILKG